MTVVCVQRNTVCVQCVYTHNVYNTSVGCKKKNAMSATTSPFHKNAWILWGGHDEHTFAVVSWTIYTKKLRIAG